MMEKTVKMKMRRTNSVRKSVLAEVRTSCSRTTGPLRTKRVRRRLRSTRITVMFERPPSSKAKARTMTKSTQFQICLGCKYDFELSQIRPFSTILSTISRRNTTKQHVVMVLLTEVPSVRSIWATMEKSSMGDCNARRMLETMTAARTRLLHHTDRRRSRAAPRRFLGASGLAASGMGGGRQPNALNCSTSSDLLSVCRRANQSNDPVPSSAEASNWRSIASTASGLA
mmetsp:Transcript_80631/g.216034  ORF Transcript_80631/g.216034 Transcript_80631/m.216034 type:complete len:228 (+) Transcript_80631:2791-3474(+)